MGKYDSISFKAPDSVRSAYRRGIELHEGGKSGSGLEAATVSMAKKIAAGESISPEWARKGNRFWGRNERFLSEEKDSPAYTSAMLWGGRPGMSWFRKLVRQMDSADGKTNSLQANRIVKKGGEYCVVSEDGDRSFGCYPSEEKAEERLGQVEYFKREGKMNQLLVNVTTKVNRSMIRRENRSGDEFVIIRSATLPDGIVMNGGLYPAEEIEKSYMTLEGKLAPLEHPTKNGDFISANSQFAIDNFYVGAANENVRRENGRVYVDKAVNVRKALETDKGKRLMDRIEAIESGDGKPIHTSTGVFLKPKELDEPVTANAGPSAGTEYNWIAQSMMFDHDAILLDGPGAATPEQGVGIAVNSAGDHIDVQFYEIDQPEDLKTNNEDCEKTNLLNKLVELFGFGDSSKPAYNSDSKYLPNEGDPMKENIMKSLKKANRYKDGMSDEEMMNAYDEMMMEKGRGKKDEKKNADKDPDGAVANQDATVAAINAALVPLVKEIDGLKAQLNSQADAEKQGDIKTVVDAGMLTKEQAEAMDAGALRSLAANCAKVNAPAPQMLDTRFHGNSSGNDYDYSNMEAPE